MSGAHTPGPWSYSWESDTRDWAIVTADGGQIVANVNTESGPDTHSVPAMRQMPAEANARLITAGPDMAEALRLGAAYDDLLKSYAGPLPVLCDGDNAAIDAAYDAWISATRSALAKIGGGV